MPHGDGSQALYRILGLLGDGVRRSGNGYEASCPGSRHRRGDKRPSLSVSLGLDGRVLLNCHGGCETEEVVSELGLSMADLFEKSANGNRIQRYRLPDHTGTIVATHVREDEPAGKRIWWESYGKNGLNGTAVERLPLYRLPDVLADRSRPVILTEGEKAAEALYELGLLAVATVTGANKTPCPESLAPLQGREVWLWPDNDDVGREHMARIARLIQPAPKWIVWPDAPEKGDAADYAASGGTADGVKMLLSEPAAPRNGTTSLRGWTARELASARFPAPRWAINDLLPAGLAILAGRPKLGKSWLALGWSAHGAMGEKVMGKLDAVQGETLYLALEDGPRRIQERLALLLGDAEPPEGMHIFTEWPRMNEGGIELMDEWLTKHPSARQVTIDTFKRVRPIEKNSQRLYDLDYDAIQPLAELARKHNVAIVVVHHTRKGESSDPLEMVSGTLGLSGAADCVMVLRRERGQADASLFVTGRDIDEHDLALRWEKEDRFGWHLLGNADAFRMSAERKRILDAITAIPGMTPTEISDAVGKSRGSTRYLLFAMIRDSEVRNRDGHYYPPNTPNSPNSASGEPDQDTSYYTPNTPNTPQNEIEKLLGVPSPTPNTRPSPLTAVSPGSSDSPNSPVRGVRAEVQDCQRCGRPESTHGPGDPAGCVWEPRA